MNNEETRQALAKINNLWNHQKFSAEALRDIGGLINKQDFLPVMAAIKRLATTEEWFHVSKLLKAMAPPNTSALEGFKKALMVTRVYSLDQRDKNAPDAVRATVARLGGWRVIGQMKTDEQQWNEKRWAAAWEEVHAEIAAGRPMAELLPAKRIGALSGVMAGALKGGE